MKFLKRAKKIKRIAKRRWPAVEMVEEEPMRKKKTDIERNLIIVNNHLFQWVNSTRIKPHKPKPIRSE